MSLHDDDGSDIELDPWERRAHHLAEALVSERRSTARWINAAGVLAVLLVIAVCVAVAEGLYA